MANLRDTTNELLGNVLAAAALGGELRLRASGAAGDPQVRAALQDVIATIDQANLDGADGAALASILGLITYTLHEALDLLREPERAPGWTFTEPAILQERGRSSGMIADRMAQLADGRPDLAAALSGQRAFLDIGTGAGWIAIAAAKRWPRLRVVGIDIWEPSLALAEANVERESLGERITIRRQSFEELDEIETYDVVWLPTPFLPRKLVERVMPRIVTALRHSGLLVFGMFAPFGGPHGEAVRKLLTVRCGGYPWSTAESTALLESAGLTAVESFRGAGPTDIILARRP